MVSARPSHTAIFITVMTVACSAQSVRIAQAQFAGNAIPSRSESAGSSPQESDSPSPDPRPGSGVPAENSAAPSKRSLQIVLREGTVLGPIRGRFVVRGQRWSFLPAAVTTATEEGKSQWVDDGLAREILPDQNTMLGRQRIKQAALPSGQVEDDVSGAQSANTSRMKDLVPAFESMLVIENLMLDRISRAIEEDPQDDYWTITATVTEFRDENRLMVLTANRARRASAQ